MLTHRTHGTSHLLTAGYRPVTEELTVHGLPVLGQLPVELDGTLLRIGANPLGAHDPALDHAFAGDAMVHGLRLRGGRAEWYRNRWLRTDRVTRALGELPTPGPRNGLGDNTNAGLVRHAGRTLALGGGGALPVQLSGELDSVARIDFDGTLPGGFGAQPVGDPLTGELHALAYDHRSPHLTHVTVDALGKVRRAEPITVKGTPMVHAFSLTDRHAVVYDLPVVFDPREAAAGSRVPYRWDDNHGARLGILPRDGGDADVLWLEIDPCYVFHAVNAFERGRHTVIDVIRHERAFDRDPLHPTESTPTLWRWTVDRLSGTVQEEQLDGRTQEFPRIDDRYAGSPYRWAFTVGLREGQGAALAGPRLLRHDLHTGRTDEHRLAPGREAGRAAFVPRGPLAPEGDGWLLTIAHDAASGHGELVVVDTADFTGPPVAVVPLPARVPHGFQTHWIADWPSATHC
ncbi:carotenoid oxygenase family protein [Kitasatospora paracochleata]|uniref:Dioxygenase n=1 Tax=Kitasatospora paracochleata TaxID=58354 RepID=A0ABT1IT28_9ACTN|nr:carotenoid oxygenase family protein [Kitasatospora paracochleata]MCP2308285.1 carotenoid cleavage dioxygenase [Kitasatospora paracochleata]